ncbi:MAG: cytochrome c3 family protein [Acidobacteriia bacterium]|nr:cytochrome c3 family protein [Terriglobia bacterium]
MAGRTRTTKKLAQRIDLNYFKRTYPIPRWKRTLSIAAVSIGVAWLGWGALTGKQSAFNAGPLAHGHLILTSNCSSCHVPSGGFGTKVTETACQSCHNAPIHQAKQTFTPACTSCHIEHQGAFRLADTSQASCTQCHRSLKTADGKTQFAAGISSFNNGHPEFAAVRPGHAADPGTIKLSHQVHMKPDLKGPNGTVRQLQCVDCHQPVSHSPNAPMAPVTYAQHCASCHPLVFDSRFAQPAPHQDTKTVHDFVVRNQGMLAQSVEEAERLLWQKTCKECHVLTYPAPEARPDILKSAILVRWMTHAKFDHNAHQLVTCTECHAQAKTSNYTADVLLPGIATCQKCHSGGRTAADTRCSECHDYHDWSKAKPASSVHTILDFVR